RVYLSSVGVTQGTDGARGPALLREVLHKEMRGKRPEWLRSEAIPTMMQMLMPEDTAVRQILVDMLARIPGPQATVALAQRAVFDLDAEVRRSAVDALKDRPAGDCRPLFLRALRYPWAPAADHAAEALVALDDKAAVAELIVLLKQPDPTLPVVLNRRYALLRDVVRANHLNNCLLCHPPAVTTAEPVLGLDPVLTISSTTAVSGAVNRVRTTPGSHSYGSGGGGTSQVPLLIRGDITFLRQDFSVRQPVAPLGFLPLAARTARFDYVVRTRYVPAKAAQELLDAVGEKTYPQREAVLHTLRSLTGKDAGTTTEGWLRMFPGAEQDAEAARLSRELRQASSVRAEVMINKLRETKRVANTMALATAIPGLGGKLREKAREALVERLTRMTAKTLRDKLRDDDPEVRRAAVQACQRKEKKELVPELIALLEDSDSLTARTAEAALVDLTGQEHRTPVDWQRWWRKQ
ncbi:MAG: HEAT repeat domain-containing protein, partial [Planctomycetes bacterium]|nr:HEAT repeat domain-containing protein [Planctomycetota bacterium]